MEKVVWFLQGYMEEIDVLLYFERLVIVFERLLDYF